MLGRVGPCGVDHACPGRRETSRNDTAVAERSIRDVESDVEATVPAPVVCMYSTVHDEHRNLKCEIRYSAD